MCSLWAAGPWPCAKPAACPLSGAASPRPRPLSAPDVVVGVCSGGQAPFYTKLLRKELEAAIPPGDGALPDVLETQREAARRGGEEAADRLIRTLRTALDRDPDLSASQLQALCEKFWQQTENYK